MKKTYVLYNPLAGNNHGKELSKEIKNIAKDRKLIYHDITEIKDYKEFCNNVIKNADIIISGGDGTLNRFINNIEGMELKNNIYYYATGTGNDFLNDIEPKKENRLYLINDYLCNLPTVTVKEKNYKFLNGIGYGIDGYCCEVGDKLKQKTTKPVNYTSIAIKGLLFHYHPTNAKICVDGKEYTFNKVWIAATMNGRFYGGGMMSAPKQNRLNKENKVSVVIMYGAGKLKTLMAFPSIFKGEHIKYTNMVRVITGKKVSVEFDKPTALQIDGETILNVEKYDVLAESRQLLKN